MINIRSFFLIYTPNAINSPLTIAFTAFYIFSWVVFSFSFSSKYLIHVLFRNVLAHVLLRSVFCKLQVLWGFPAMFLLLVSSLIQLWSESILCMIFSLKFILRCVLRPSICPILGNVLYEFERNVYSVVVGWRILLGWPKSSFGF